MSAPMWTPGPWRIAKDEHVTLARIEDHTGCIVATAVMEADARLIAAAPEMAELLRESTETIGGDWRDRRDTLLSTIAPDGEEALP